MSDASRLIGHNAPYAVKMTPEAVVQYLQRFSPVGETQRQAQLARYDAFWRSRQYNHQDRDWWGRNADVAETVAPLVNVPPGFEMVGGASGLLVRDKRPTAPSNSVPATVRRYTSLLFSRSRKPKISVTDDPETDKFLENVITQARFWNVMKMARNKGGAMGSVAITVHLREGRFCFEVHSPRHLHVVWKDRRTWEPAGFLKMFSYGQLEASYDDKGRYAGHKEVQYLYRRIITERHDIVYKPVKLDGADPSTMAWEVEESMSTVHDLGFFPGAWIQNFPDDENMDGMPDCEGAWQIYDTVDRLNSQSNKALLQNQDPTLVLKYTDKEVGMNGPLATGSDNAMNVGPSGDAKFLEITATGVSQSRDFVRELRRSASELTGMVFPDAEKMSGAAQSALAIELLMLPTIERADDLREQYGMGVKQILDVTRRMGAKYEGQEFQDQDGKRYRYKLDLPPQWDEVEGPNGNVVRVEVPYQIRTDTTIEIQWGSYFEPTELDRQQKISNANAAYQAGGIDRETKIREIAGVFGIEADAEYVEKIIEEERERIAQMGSLGDPYGDIPFGHVREEDAPHDEEEPAAEPGDGGRRVG